MICSNCKHSKTKTVADDAWGYMGQGDYHLHITCLKGLSTQSEYAKKGMEFNCPEYDAKTRVKELSK